MDGRALDRSFGCSGVKVLIASLSSSSPIGMGGLAYHSSLLSCAAFRRPTIDAIRNSGSCDQSAHLNMCDASDGPWQQLHPKKPVLTPVNSRPFHGAGRVRRPETSITSLQRKSEQCDRVPANSHPFGRDQPAIGTAKGPARIPIFTICCQAAGGVTPSGTI